MRLRSSSCTSILVLLTLGALGCQGEVASLDFKDSEEPPPSPMRPDLGGVSMMDATMPPTQVACDTLEPMDRPPLRLLTNQEYMASLETVFGQGLEGQTELGTRLIPEARSSSGFFNDARLRAVTEDSVRIYFESSASVAQWVLAKPDRTARAMPCDAGIQSEEACAKSLIQTTGERLFRRPLDAQEQARFLALFDTARHTHQAKTEEALTAVLRALLNSPQFLYRIDLGEIETAAPAGGRVALTPYELATKLSFLLWGTTPDDALLEAAGSGGLDTRAQIIARAKEMLKDPRTIQAQTRFYDQWLELEEVEDLKPDQADALGPALLGSIRQESHKLIEDVIWGDSPDVTTLLTTNTAWVNAPMAKIYGVDEAGLDDQTWRRVQLDPTRYAGVITRSAFNAIHAHPNKTSPVLRGYALRKRLMCGAPQTPLLGSI